VGVVKGRVLLRTQQAMAQIAHALSHNPARRYPFAHSPLRAERGSRRVSVERRAFLRGGADESLLPHIPHMHEHISTVGRRQARESQSPSNQKPSHTPCRSRMRMQPR
jgi:hypothetical protein